MKELILILFCTITLNANANAQSKVETLNIMDKTYTVTTDFPDEIIGEYLYESKGEPKVLLNKDGSGYFQPHQTAPIKIKFWIDCDEHGKLRKQEATSGRYKYTLVIQYLDGTNRNHTVGSYNIIGVMIQPDLGRVSMLGERFKPL